MRRYIIGRGWGPHPAAAESPKDKQRKKGKPKNQKFEALYNREGLGPPPGSSGKPKRERKEKGKPGKPRREKENKEKQRPKNQKFEALSIKGALAGLDVLGMLHRVYRPPGEPARYTSRGNAPNQATSKVVRKRLDACVRGCLVA